MSWFTDLFKKPPVWEPPERLVTWRPEDLPLHVGISPELRLRADLIRSVLEQANRDFGFRIFEPTWTDALRNPKLYIAWGAYEPGSGGSACPCGNAEVVRPGKVGQSVLITLYGDALATDDGLRAVVLHEAGHAIGFCHNDRQRNLMASNVLDLIQMVPPELPDPMGHGPLGAPLPLFPPGFTDAQRSEVRKRYCP